MKQGFKLELELQTEQVHIRLSLAVAKEIQYNYEKVACPHTSYTKRIID